jgi:NitT/TauT family transport system permease protein
MNAPTNSPPEAIAETTAGSSAAWYENSALAMALVVLLLGGLWALAAWWLGFSSFPGPVDALRALPALLFDPNALLAMAMSLGRMAIGYVWALVFAVPLGLAMGRSQFVHDLVHPLASLSYPMPKAALMPILMLWFGLGSFSKILVIAMGVSLPMLYHSCLGASRVENKLVWTAQAMGMKAVARLFRVVLPAALPEILIGCRVGVIMALIVMVSSEMIARQEGVGNLLFTSMDMAQYSSVYAVILILALMGVVLNWLFEKVRRYLTRWAESVDDNALR